MIMRLFVACCSNTSDKEFSVSRVKIKFLFEVALEFFEALLEFSLYNFKVFYLIQLLNHICYLAEVG